MELSAAIRLIENAVPKSRGLWADLGAGTGLFTMALATLLPEQSHIYAVDKSPHSLYKMLPIENQQVTIIDSDFTKPFNCPPLDGIIMANALHYVKEKGNALAHILSYLKKGGIFILIEYDTDRPTPIWVPHPISYQRYQTLIQELPLEKPEQISSTPSMYGHQEIYVAAARKT